MHLIFSKIGIREMIHGHTVSYGKKYCGVKKIFPAWLKWESLPGNIFKYLKIQRIFLYFHLLSPSHNYDFIYLFTNSMLHKPTMWIINKPKLGKKTTGCARSSKHIYLHSSPWNFSEIKKKLWTTETTK